MDSFFLTDEDKKSINGNLEYISARLRAVDKRLRDRGASTMNIVYLTLDLYDKFKKYHKLDNKKKWRPISHEIDFDKLYERVENIFIT